jgi:8-oxo-dGTP pyrophosphatase MutT (NUDIX family)
MGELKVSDGEAVGLKQAVLLWTLKRVHRWRRALTLGARVAVFDKDGRILLVRHTYSPGWIFPGGGVEFGETAVSAAAREIREEAGIIEREQPALFGFYSNHVSYPGDHLVFFTLRQYTREHWVPNSEIAAAEFFPVDQCPQGTTAGTLRRLAEISGVVQKSPEW